MPVIHQDKSMKRQIESKSSRVEENNCEASCSIYTEKQTNVSANDRYVFHKKKCHKAFSKKSRKRKVEPEYLSVEEITEDISDKSVDKQLRSELDDLKTFHKRKCYKVRSNESMNRNTETGYLRVEKSSDDISNTYVDKQIDLSEDELGLYQKKKPHKVQLRPSCEYLRTLQAGEIDYSLVNEIAAYEVAKPNVLKLKLEEVMSIHIEINWIVPPIHRSMAVKFRQNIQKHGVEVGLRFNGPFSPDEDKLIISNWEKFQEMSGIKDVQTMQVFHLHGGKKHVVKYKKLQFYQFLGKGLDNRLLHSISYRFWKLMQPVKVGLFSKKESALIVHFVEEYGTNFKFLSKIMKKDYFTILGHYKTLTETTDPAHLYFSFEEDEKLVSSVLKRSMCKTATEVDEKKIPWKMVAKDVGRTIINVKYRWQRCLKVKMSLKNPVSLFEMRCKLIYRLLELNVKYWQDIDWISLSKDVIGHSSTFVAIKLHALVNYHVPDHKQKTLRECLEYLRDYWIPHTKPRLPRTRIIPLILNKEGKLVPKDESDQEDETEK